MEVNISSERQNKIEVGDLIKTDSGHYLMIMKEFGERYHLINLMGKDEMCASSIEELLYDITITEHYKNNELELRLKGE